MPLTSKRGYQLTMSELRGIFLVIIGVVTLGYYYSWWFHDGRLDSFWLALGLACALFYGVFQILASWLVYLWTHHRPDVFCPPPDNLTIDVFVTVCNEEYELVERAVEAACAMLGEHRTWLLDDGSDPALARLAQHLGAGYLTRPNRLNAKAGNINAALAHTQGDIVVIFDIDHVPRADFLERTLGCFVDPKVGFIQVMPTFSNAEKSWVARAAGETSHDFYNPTSKGMDGLSSVTKMGSNSLIRRTALESIDGYQPGLAEDLATSIALHAAGWSSRYVAEPLAPGLAPPDLAAWFTQQLKWSRGVFEILLTTYPRLFRRLSWGQRLSYAVRTSNYFIGPVICVHLAVTIAVLLGGAGTAWVDLLQYFVHFMPLFVSVLLIRQLALRRWRHPSVLAQPAWRAVALVYSTWPIYTLAWLMAVLRFPLGFRPTPKTSGGFDLRWLLPQLATVVVLAAGVVYSALMEPDYSRALLLYGCAVFLGLPHLWLLGQFLGPKPAVEEIKKANYRVTSQDVVSNKHI